MVYSLKQNTIARQHEFKPAGRYTVEFTGHNLASGVYFYRLLVDDGKEYIKTKKMVFVK